MYCTIPRAEIGWLTTVVPSFIHPDRDENPGGAASARGSNKPKGAAPPLRILVVEDDFILQQDLRLSLTEAGYCVAGGAASAGEAVRIARETRPDLVIMDIRLHGARDGVDAAIEIYETLGIRSIFASADDSGTALARAAAARPLGWLSKPYDMAALLGLICDVGGRRLN